ncbi:MAG: hypothetical protein PHC56_04640 [Herbinix sp.]|nr:hypothetical protein [Herbinix sp.]
MNTYYILGYLVAGLFLGPSFIKLVSGQDIESHTPINELAYKELERLMD